MNCDVWVLKQEKKGTLIGKVFPHGKRHSWWLDRGMGLKQEGLKQGWLVLIGSLGRVKMYTQARKMMKRFLKGQRPSISLDKLKSAGKEKQVDKTRKIKQLIWKWASIEVSDKIVVF